MDQAAGIVGGGADEGTTPKPSGRPILTVSGRSSVEVSPERPAMEAVAVDSSGTSGQVAESAPIASSSGPSTAEPSAADATIASASEVEAAAGDASVIHASAQAPVDAGPSSEGDGKEGGPSSPDGVEPAKDGATQSTAPEDAEHEGVELARKAKAEEEKAGGSADGVQSEAGAEGVDPVAEGIASAMGGGTPESDPNSVVAVGPVVTEESGRPGSEGAESAGAPMSYHDALNHLNRTAARRGHVDIDDRITEYVRTQSRGALDRPSRATKKREDRALRDGTADPKLLEARRIVEGGITSKDIKVQAAIDGMGARSSRSATDEVKSKTKGPAASRQAESDGIDPAVAAAAASSREAPGL